MGGLCGGAVTQGPLEPHVASALCYLSLDLRSTLLQKELRIQLKRNILRPCGQPAFSASHVCRFTNRHREGDVWLHSFPVGRQGGGITEVVSASLT